MFGQQGFAEGSVWAVISRGREIFGLQERVRGRCGASFRVFRGVGWRFVRRRGLVGGGFRGGCGRGFRFG